MYNYTRMLVHALISNRVDYCNSILHHVAAAHLRPFQSVLNAAARLIARKRKFDRIMPTLRDHLHWLPVQTMFACVKMSTPDRTTIAGINVRPAVGPALISIRSAARNDLLIPRTRTASYGPRSFSVSGPTCWNSLPQQLKSASLTLQQFCDRLKTVVLLFSHGYA